jgi:tRNA(Arg) A34 adenosine deaminase TadA
VNFFDSLETPWQVAFEEAWEAWRCGSLPIGAAIVLDGEVIARGRNRLGEAHTLVGFLAGTNIAHAEINALVQIPMHLENQELHLYTTLEPCPMCAGAIRMSHIQHLYFAAHSNSGASHLLETDAYMSREWLTVHRPSNGLLGNASVILNLVAQFEENPTLDRYYQNHAKRYSKEFTFLMQPEHQAFLVRAKHSLQVRDVLDWLAERLG